MYLNLPVYLARYHNNEAKDDFEAFVHLIKKAYFEPQSVLYEPTNYRNLQFRVYNTTQGFLC